jgi:hypothetical protein
MFFISIINSAEIQTSTAAVDLEAANHEPIARSAITASSGASEQTPLISTAGGLAERMAALLSADYERNVGDVIQSRWFFRKVSNCTEACGNILLYLSASAPAIAAAVHPFDPSVANYITCSGLICLGAHVALIGTARCSAREEGERENQLAALAQEVGYRVVPLRPIVTDDGAET